MSERMIELHRARLLATGKGSNNNAQAVHHLQQNGTQPHNRSSTALAQSAAAAASARQTPRQAATNYVQSEDTKMQRFFQLLQDRDDSRADSLSGPTVPTSLSRRILHKQGAGYLDDTVGAVVSAAADRFLGIVLQQAVACRDQRLKGAEMTREASRYRKRHLEQYQQESDDRQRRKQDAETRREMVNLAAIEAAEALKKTGAAAAEAASSSVDGTSASTNVNSKSKKKKAPDTVASPGNGVGMKRKQRDDDQDDEISYDSIDEEEDYYQQYYATENEGLGRFYKDGEEDVDDDMLILRDIARPLEAWDFHVTGKVGLEPAEPAEEEDDDDFLDVDNNNNDDNDDENFLADQNRAGSDDADSDQGEKDYFGYGDQKSPENSKMMKSSSSPPPASNNNKK